VGCPPLAKSNRQTQRNSTQGGSFIFQAPPQSGTPLLDTLLAG
jgi:hypothetical protein